MDSLFFYINKLCLPHPNVYPHPSLQEMAFRRNKATLLIQLSCFIFVIIYNNLNGQENPIQKGCLYTLTFVTLAFLTFCRSYPHAPNLMYFILITVFGPFLHFYYKDGVFFNSIGVVILPAWILCVSGNKVFFLMQIIIQNLYLHFLYKPRMMLVSENMYSEAYFTKICMMSSFGVIVNAIFLLTTIVSLEKTYFHAMKAETRKITLQHQKAFILTFSHEVRNLINNNIGNIRLAMKEALLDSRQTLLRNSEICGEVLLHLVNNILDTGKVQVGELEINPTLNKGSEVWEKTWGICSQLIKNKRLSGQMRIQKKIPELLKIDSYRLMQIFLNLVGNSLKFTESGAVTIDIQWIEGQTEVNEKSFYPRPFSEAEEDTGLFEKEQAFAFFDKSCEIMGVDSKMNVREKSTIAQQIPQSGILKIIVSDTGCGIPSDKMALLFQKFGQVHEDASKRKLGTGLGLFITSKLVHKMGGEIKAFSRYKKGSAFVVCIPVESGQANQRNGWDFCN